jgi:hypothetical protein
MSGVGALALVASVLAAAGQRPATPVVIVEDPRQISAVLGFKPDSTFTPSPEEAEGPRRDLARYVDAERSREKKNPYRKEALGRIRKAVDRYVWYCGGYTQKGERLLFCTFVLGTLAGGPQPGPKAFPVIDDGGTSVCYCHYDLKAGKIVKLFWNGEA